MKATLATDVMTTTLLPRKIYPAAWDKIAGQSSGIGEKQALVVASQKDWEALWARHCAGRSAPLPPVDFSHEIIVAVFLGLKAAGGCAVEMKLKPQSEDPAGLVASYREVSSSRTASHPGVFSQPFEIRKVSAHSVILTED